MDFSRRVFRYSAGIFVGNGRTHGVALWLVSTCIVIYVASLEVYNDACLRAN